MFWCLTVSRKRNSCWRDSPCNPGKVGMSRPRSLEPSESHQRLWGLEDVWGIRRMFDVVLLDISMWYAHLCSIVIRNAGLSGSVRFDSSRLTHLYPLNTPVRAAESVTGASWWMGYACLILQARSRWICFHSQHIYISIFINSLTSLIYYDLSMNHH